MIKQNNEYDVGDGLQSVEKIDLDSARHDCDFATLWLSDSIVCLFLYSYEDLDPDFSLTSVQRKHCTKLYCPQTIHVAPPF